MILKSIIVFGFISFFKPLYFSIAFSIFVFGNLIIVLFSKYIELLSILKNQNMNTDLISKYYFHKNKIWDLYFEILKVPNINGSFLSTDKFSEYIKLPLSPT